MAAIASEQPLRSAFGRLPQDIRAVCAALVFRAPRQFRQLVADVSATARTDPTAAQPALKIRRCGHPRRRSAACRARGATLFDARPSPSAGRFRRSPRRLRARLPRSAWALSITGWPAAWAMWEPNRPGRSGHDELGARFEGRAAGGHPARADLTSVGCRGAQAMNCSQGAKAATDPCRRAATRLQGHGRCCGARHWTRLGSGEFLISERQPAIATKDSPGARTRHFC